MPGLNRQGIAPACDTPLRLRNRLALGRAAHMQIRQYPAAQYLHAVRRRNYAQTCRELDAVAYGSGSVKMLCCLESGATGKLGNKRDFAQPALQETTSGLDLSRSPGRRLHCAGLEQFAGFDNGRSVLPAGLQQPPD